MTSLENVVYTGVYKEDEMLRTGIKQIRQNLTKYLKQVQDGEEIIITKREEPIAKIIPIHKKRAKKLSSHAELRSIIEKRGKPLSKIVSESREERF